MNTAIYQALDDDALAALANRGLLRRAQKDLESAPPERRAETDDAITFAFPAEGCVVTLPSTGPAQATCDCPAAGCCRHILTAALALRAAPTPGPSPEGRGEIVGRDGEAEGEVALAPKDTDAVGVAPTQSDKALGEIMGLGERELAGWATRAVYNQGCDDVTTGEVEVEIAVEAAMVVFRFPQQNVVTRWLIGAGPEGMICSCKRPHACRHRVAAILAYQRAHGALVVGAAMGKVGLRAASGAPRSRTDTLASVRATLIELVALGTGALAPSIEGRLRTLATSAHGVDLPLLESRLRALSDLARWQINRDVRADSAQLLRATARVYALAVALGATGAANEATLAGGMANPAARLIGEHRGRYFEVGALDLVGLGAQQWRTRSGYAGLTVFFWDVAGERWASWSESRPSFYNNTWFDPAQRYTQDAVWEGAPPPSALSRSRLHLTNARRTREGRLSAHAGAQAFVTSAADPTALADALTQASARLTDWAALGQRLAAQHGDGLTESDTLARLVVVSPVAWGAPTYDERRQALLRPVYDAAGRALTLVMPHSDEWPAAIDTLRDLKPEEANMWGVLGLGAITRDGLELTPISLLLDTGKAQVGQASQFGAVVNLTLDGVRRASGTMLTLTKTQLSVAEMLAMPSAANAATNTTTPQIGQRTRAPIAPSAQENADDDTDDTDDLAPTDDGDGADEGEAGAKDLREGDQSAVGATLGAALAALERLAERGARVGGAAFEGELRDQAERMRQLGLTLCADALAALEHALAANRHRAAPDVASSADALLRCAYVIGLAHDDIITTRLLTTLA